MGSSLTIFEQFILFTSLHLPALEFIGVFEKKEVMDIIRRWIRYFDIRYFGTSIHQAKRCNRSKSKFLFGMISMTPSAGSAVLSFMGLNAGQRLRD